MSQEIIVNSHCQSCGRGDAEISKPKICCECPGELEDQESWRHSVRSCTASACQSPLPPAPFLRIDREKECPFHQKPLQIWCKTCYCLACIKCTANTHKQHDWNDLEECIPEVKGYIAHCITEVREKIDSQMTTIDDVIAKEEAILGKYEKFEKEIQKSKKQTMDKIKKFKDAKFGRQNYIPEITTFESNLENVNVENCVIMEKKYRDIDMKSKMLMPQDTKASVMKDLVCSYADILASNKQVTSSALVIKLNRRNQEENQIFVPRNAGEEVWKKNLEQAFPTNSSPLINFFSR